MTIEQRHIIAGHLQSAIQQINWPNDAQEPDYVAKMVDVLPDIITRTLTWYLPGRTISAGGAFIHQKPLAHFLDKSGFKDPELGDLLIICREKRFSGFVYNAMLLQAKRTVTPYEAQIPDDHQYILYSQWPEFEYRRAGSLNGKRRSVLPKTITQGAQYLLIDDVKSAKLFTATVDRPFCSSNLFAWNLAAILSFDAGRTFQVTNPRDDWSQMIVDLLRLSASAVFNRRHSGYIGTQRWKGDAAFNYILNTDVQNVEKGLLKYHDVNGEDAFAGVSVICIDLGASSKEQELE